MGRLKQIQEYRGFALKGLATWMFLFGVPLALGLLRTNPLVSILGYPLVLVFIIGFAGRQGISEAGASATEAFLTLYAVGLVGTLVTYAVGFVFSLLS